ncbi:outer membrane beta-barrel protein [Foetidibacter luteolus]|uniref:outer membrane beta-barrel protein n=1 Tax=Foetidibacter luteolus TaxID=2608880 RepID=UPI00129AB1C9|nr:outer membrane beta-barrel protein [Foetidibacter luteolus]
MTDNQFDDFFRKKLQNHESSVPEDMWQKIERRKDRPRKRFGFWPLSLAALLITGLAGGYLLHNSNSGQPGAVVKVAEPEQNKQQEKTITNNKTEADSTNSTQQSGNTEKNTDSNNALATAGDKKEQNVAAARANGKKENTGYVSAGVSAGKKTPGKTNLQSAQPQDIATSTPTATRQAEGEKPAKEQKAGNAKPEETVSAFTDDSSAKADTTKKAVDKAKDEPTLADIIVTGMGKKKEKKYREPKQRLIELFASPEIAWKQTTAANGFGNYVKEKNKAEKQTISFSVGLRFTQMLSEHFFIKTGLQYSQVREQFNYKGASEYRISSVIVARNLPTSNGNIYNVSTSAYGQWGYRLVANTNRYSSFEVPLLLGYQTAGPSFRAYVNAGVLFGITTSYSGYTVDSLYKAANINDAGLYKSNLGTSVYVGAGLIKDISGRFSLFAEPYLRYRLGGMTRSSKPFSQKIHTAGLAVGLRYKF